jgi:hypothetical protein
LIAFLVEVQLETFSLANSERTLSGSIRGPEALEELQSSGEILAGFGAVLRRQQLASLERGMSAAPARP